MNEFRPVRNIEIDRAGKMSEFMLRGCATSSRKLLAGAIVCACLATWGSPAIALLAGMLFSVTAGNPLGSCGPAIARRLLQVCVVLLGFGMQLPELLKAGWNGAPLAAATIGITLLLGHWVGRWLGLSRNTAALISAGTAICGGSAIAAVGSVLVVGEGEVAMALGTVFTLNAVALYLFPFLGHALHLTGTQFGLWAGIGIHDISSVVGAALNYGGHALETATAVKLSRTLWIVPVTLAWSIVNRRGADADRAVAESSAGRMTAGARAQASVPWFIGLFLLASVARSYVPIVGEWSPQISKVAAAGLTVVLFLIGATLSPRALRTVGWRAAVQGMVLWLVLSAASLIAVARMQC